LYENLQRYSKNAARVVELEAELEKQTTLQALAKDQADDLRQSNEELSSQLDEMS